MTRVKVNRITEKGINLPPSEYDDEQPIIIQIVAHPGIPNAAIFGLGEDGRVYLWRNDKSNWELY